jgi:CelD/BcsL family acetyltransferase involved in cellulose biosynthesis
MTPPMRAFFLDLAQAFSARGWLDLTFLSVNGVQVATYMNFLFRDEVWVYNSGFSETAEGVASPGWLLLSYCIEHAIALGYRRYDFLRGDELYKFRFGAHAEPIYQVRLQCTPQLQPPIPRTIALQPCS